MAMQPWQEAKAQLTELPRWQRIGTLLVGPVELVLTAAAVIDLARRPAAEIRGPKAMWWLGILVQPVGPIAYLKWARRY